jgi:hypothetical protein
LSATPFQLFGCLFPLLLMMASTPDAIVGAFYAGSAFDISFTLLQAPGFLIFIIGGLPYFNRIIHPNGRASY